MQGRGGHRCLSWQGWFLLVLGCGGFVFYRGAMIVVVGRNGMPGLCLLAALVESLFGMPMRGIER